MGFVRRPRPIHSQPFKLAPRQVDFLRMRSIGLVLCLFASLGCGASSTDGAGSGEDRLSPLEVGLRGNSEWPYEAVGVLDIVEAVYGDESEHPTAAFGSLLSEGDDEWGVPIEIGPGVVAKAGINIDSGSPVRVWLGAPKNDYGDETYPIARIEPL